MAFSSLQFLIFFLMTLAVYYIVPQKIKVIWLLLCSYCFYACFGLKNVLILLISTFVVYAGALIIENMSDGRCKKTVMAVEVVLNLLMLLVFKYANFVIDNLNAISEKLHLAYEINEFSLILPVGISFYIFSAISYTIDVYKGKINAEKNIYKFALYMSYFPKVTSGPIERFDSFKEQLESKINFDYENVKDGFLLALLGFAQKLIMADRIGVLVATVFDNYTEYKGFVILVASLLYTVQIYCDFTGYTNIALGISQMLGIHLKDNFEQPYLATTIKDFWRRWHISLTSWFRDYLYIPLGGNRKGTLRKYVNVAIVFAVSGLWHGASWNFIVWGMLHGVYQIVESIIEPWIRKLNEVLRVRTDNFSYRFGQWIVTFSLVNFAWIFFRASGLKTAFGIVKNMFAVYNPWVFFDGTLYKLGLDSKEFILVLIGSVIIFGIDIWREKMSVRNWIRSQNLWFRWGIYLLLIFSILILGFYNNGYSSGAFIYNQF